MTTSSLYTLPLILSLCAGCGGADFAVQPGDEETSADADGRDVLPGEDTRLGTSADAGPDAPEVASETGPGVDSGPGESAVDSGPPPPTQKRVFVTSEAYTADMGGLVGADAKCQKLADAAKLGGVYKAWLSDSVTSAKSRLTHATVPYKLVDGTVVANDWAELTSTTGIAHAIDATETGSKQTTASKDCGFVPGVWTNTNISGDRGKFSCENWTSTASVNPTGEGASVGRTDKSNTGWTGYCSYAYCKTAPSAGWVLAFALYCLEQ